jgi:GPH family glycoside/pentoside/hexuronide:cation symporter
VNRLGLPALAAYGLLGLPLAMAALPLYVHLPKLYGADLGMDLALVGVVLLVTRFGDAVSDPLLGAWSDRVRDRRIFVVAALPLLALGMLGLFHPPADASLHAAWLGALLVVTYLGFSAASISYQAWGAQLSDDLDERTRITAAREVFTLVGVVTAAAAPQFLGGEQPGALATLSIAFAALLGICAALTLAFAPRPAAHSIDAEPLAHQLARPFANVEFRWLLGVFALSGIAAAIPSTLVLFFIADVIDAADRAGLFLVVYFVAGAAGMPAWVALARRIGKRNAWLAGMALSVAAFAWAWRLGPGDVGAYALICALSGLALGADLALPASLLADVIERGARNGRRGEGSYFGVWNLVTKANLAIAAGLALPALAALGYAPGSGGEARALALVYCLLPCALKLAAAALLWTSPLGRDAARQRISRRPA